jgi:ATP-dependent RNA/DNA helicase IGHMBP2
MDALKSGRLDIPAAGLVSVCFGARENNKPRFREVKTETCNHPEAFDCTFLARQSSNLNEPQQAAIVKALCAFDMAIIHGPPGTGKTTTLVAYILEAAYRKQRLLVTAPSNVAVDNLLERVLDCGFKSVVRLGHPARVQAELHRYTMDNVVYASDQAALCRDIKKEIDDALKKSHGRGGAKTKDDNRRTSAELNALRKELRTRERRAVAEVLRHTQVVFATCAGAATLHREIKKGSAGDSSSGGSLEFDVVIIDEAAQSLEVACWIPLLLGKKAVLAGDHQQLSATVKSSEAQRRGLDRTLFGRMIERHGDDVSVLLSIQYRMNEIIMGWSSKSFYHERLLAAESVAARTLQLSEVPAVNIVGDTLEALTSPFLFVDTGGLDLYREDGADGATDAKKLQSGGSVHQSRSNPGEATFLVHYAKLLVKAGLKPQDLTVISPYNRQVERLRATFSEDGECEKLGLEKPRINTVDSFQGQEADAVLLSLVRSNPRGVVGFLSDYRRLNVAVTRARKHVMLVGDAATISCDETLASLYDYACEHGRVVFVQQLLDEDGDVPPDPSAVQEPRRPAKVKGKMEKDKAKREENAKREEQLRKKFEEQFRPLLEPPGYLDLPSTLNPYERALAHEVATSLGLQHESKGEGMQRHLVVWSPGCKVDFLPSAESAAQPEQPTVRKSEAPEAHSKSRPSGDAVAADVTNEDPDSDAETALQAFERRAAALLSGLGPNQPAAEWKSPTDEEMEILERLAGDAGLPAPIIVGSGKKRRCRIEVQLASESPAASSTAPAESATPAAAAGGANNATLASLHAERQSRKAKEAEERKQQNAAAKAELKTAKKVGRQKLDAVGGKPADDDDLDAILSEMSSKDGICAFGTCREKTNMLIDTVSKCRHCDKRFCLKHVQAECHGCGDAASRSEQKKWKQVQEVAMNPRGSGLVNKSCGDNRSQIASKLQDKLGKAQAKRTVQSKDKKK